MKLLGAASLELRGDIAAHRGDFETARTLLARADEAEKKLGYSEPPQYSRPALEVLGALCTRAGKFDEARAAFGKALARRPRSGFALYGIAAAWEKRGSGAKPPRPIAISWKHGHMRIATYRKSGRRKSL